MKGIYLAAFQANHPNYNIVYQDINGKRDISGDMMQIDLAEYDFIIATPPCNFWSRANRNPSKYAIETAHLLPDILDKLISLDKPFIVENVQNRRKMLEYGILNKKCFIYFVGRHTYFTNVMLSFEGLHFDYEMPHLKSKSNRQGGQQVHDCIEIFLETISCSKSEVNTQ